MKMKKKMLVTDYVIWEEICNLRCNYCKEKKVPWQRSAKTAWLGEQKYSIDNMLERVESVLALLEEAVDTPILKISGGEISLIPEIGTVLKKVKNRYETIQILTNGVAISPGFFETLAEVKNLHIQLSLDGHTYEMNRCRFSNKEQFNRTTENLKTLAQGYQMPLEINCALNPLNYKNLLEFVEWLQQLDRENLRLNIFPVRGIAGLTPPAESSVVFETLLEEYDNFQDVLLPYGYMEDLYRFLKYGQRKDNCLIPFAVLGAYDTGAVNLCTCSPLLPTLGNLLKDGPNCIRDKLLAENLYLPLKETPTPHYSTCRSCYIHYDIINLFFKDRVSEDEMANIPFYGGTQTQKRLTYLKSLVKE